MRAEFPGVDPAQGHRHHGAQDGQLTIKAERSEKKDFDGRSEFAYGSFVRTVSLPAGADENDIEADLRHRAFSPCRWRFRRRSRPSGTFRSSPPTDTDRVR